MRSKFDEKLSLLNTELIKMGALCEKVISIAAKALENKDNTLAKQVGPLKAEIDRMERDIEALCLKLLLREQPVARDLRQISAALKIITDMERIGDQAMDISEIILTIDSLSYISQNVYNISGMAEEVIWMVTKSVDSYVSKDTARAEEVIAHDDIVDSCFDRVKLALIRNIAEDSDCGEYAVDLLMIDKYLERIGDHAVNIAEWVIFAVTGVHKGAVL